MSIHSSCSFFYISILRYLFCSSLSSRLLFLNISLVSLSPTSLQKHIFSLFFGGFAFTLLYAMDLLGYPVLMINLVGSIYSEETSYSFLTGGLLSGLCVSPSSVSITAYSFFCSDYASSFGASWKKSSK